MFELSHVHHLITRLMGADSMTRTW